MNSTGFLKIWCESNAIGGLLTCLLATCTVGYNIMPNAEFCVVVDIVVSLNLKSWNVMWLEISKKCAQVGMWNLLFRENINVL